MLRALKPFAGPVAVVFFEIGAGMMNWHDQFVAGVLIGIAAFWFVMALFGTRALLKRLPWLVEWMPFLDPTGEMRSDNSALSGKYISGQSFKIADITYNGKVMNRHFEDCDIYGPAVLCIDGFGHIVNIHFDAPKEAICITTDQTLFIGPIHVINCTFKNIRFYGIGLLGSSTFKDRLNAAWDD